MDYYNRLRTHQASYGLLLVHAENLFKLVPGICRPHQMRDIDKIGLVTDNDKVL